MTPNQEILVEIQEVAPMLANLQYSSTYRVPENYFTTLADQIIEKAISPSSPVSNPYVVPENYFQYLSSNILQKVKQQNNFSEIEDELQPIAPLLNTISKKNVYTVPSGYFQHRVFKKTAETPVFNIKRINKFINYAAAAIMAGILVTGVVLNYDSNSFDITKEAKSYSDEELKQYLNNSSHSNFISDYNLNILSEPSTLKENLKYYSDEELQQYLEENAEDTSSKSLEGI